MNRRLGYIVDLEDRRGKDEQRVDEGLHLWIYKVNYIVHELLINCRQTFRHSYVPSSHTSAYCTHYN